MILPWDNKETKERNSGGYVRERSADPYHSYRWWKLSKRYRKQHPLCAECQRKGIIAPATCVDHIIPYPICKDYFFDESNLQPLCDKCNAEKGNWDKEAIRLWRLKHNERDG